MSTCVDCFHWSPKATDPRMVRLGFAQCQCKPVGHTTSHSAPRCERFRQADDAVVLARRAWQAKQAGSSLGGAV